MSQTPNMFLTLPVVGTTVGPTWANNINADLSIIDSHNHSAGNGVQIPTSGLNIDADLGLKQYSLIDARSIKFVSLGSTYSTATINRLYVVNGELYYNDDSGAPVQITLNGNVNTGSTGSISGIIPPASASYSPLTKTFTWLQASSTGAIMDCGPVITRPAIPGAKGIQLLAPSGLAADQTLTLPAKPAAQSLVGMSSLGVQSTVTPNSTITVSSTTISVATLGITDGYLASNSVITTKILDGNVTQAKLGPKVFSSSGNISYDDTSSTSPSNVFGLSVSISARAGYTLKIEALPTGAGGASQIQSNGSGTDIDLNVTLPDSSQQVVNAISMFADSAWPVNAISAIYTPASSGTYTFFVSWAVLSMPGVATAKIYNVKLVAYEL